MNKKPLLIATATVLAVGVPVGAIAVANDASSPGDAVAAASRTPRVTDLDIDLVNGRTFVASVEARDAESVRVTYAGRTATARLDRDEDDGDRERDYIVRFAARQGDRTESKRVSMRIKATRGSESTTRTLTDRVDVDNDND